MREPHPEGIDVYNLESEDFHTYFVFAGDARAPPIWVHNCAPTATVDELMSMMNKRLGTKAKYATGDQERYMKFIGASGSHNLDIAGNSTIFLRKDIANRETAFHEWLHRYLQRQVGGPRPDEEKIIDTFLERHRRLLKLDQ